MYVFPSDNGLRIRFRLKPTLDEYQRNKPTAGDLVVSKLWSHNFPIYSRPSELFNVSWWPRISRKRCLERDTTDKGNTKVDECCQTSREAAQAGYSGKAMMK